MKVMRAVIVLVASTVTLLLFPALPALAAPAVQVGWSSVDGVDRGSLERSQTAAIKVFLGNSGDETATGVAATLTSVGPGITVTDAGPKPYHDLVPGGDVTLFENEDPFEVAISSDAPCDPADFSMAVTTDQGSFELPFTIAVACPEAPHPDIITVSPIEIRVVSSGERLERLILDTPVRLLITVVNDGDADARDVKGTLSAPGGDAEIVDAEAEFGPIGVGQTPTGEFALTMTSCRDAGLILFLAIEGAPTPDDFGGDGVTPPPAGTLGVTVPTRCPGFRPVFQGISVDDTEDGNGDASAQPGETVAITITIGNNSVDPITGFHGTIHIDDADIIEGTATFPDVGAGGQVHNETPFVVKIHEAAKSITLGSGCHVYNGPWASAAAEMVVLRGTIDLTADQGETTFWVGTPVACVLAAHGTADDGLPATGSPIRALLAAGLILVCVGMTLRRAGRVGA